MKKYGPALLVTAAFIGPGTVTTATLAGGQFGFTLVWALLFSVIATFVLQEMALRLGLVTGQGLAEAIRNQFSGTAKLIAIILIVSAIGLGNAAYQAGNITGAALGIAELAGGDVKIWVWLLGGVATLLLFSGKYALIEKALISLVLIMSTVFIATMILAKPDWSAMISGLFAFQIPDGANLMVIALIGTTVVPYNLFLHASVVAKNAPPASQLNQALGHNRIDSALSIGLGGLITLAIISCAATAFFATRTPVDTANIAQQLAPLLGSYANYFFATGLFAAGLTSAITAPLAAAFAVTGALGCPAELNQPRFKLVWFAVIIVGVLFASLGIKPLVAILFAQATNGLLLPIIALYLLWTMNSKPLLGQHRNGPIANVFGIAIVSIVTFLGMNKLYSLFF